MGFVARPRLNEAAEMKHRRDIRLIPQLRSGFAGFRFPPDVILLAVRWYLRYGLSYQDLEELLAERGIEVDHVTLFPVGPAVQPTAGGGSETLSPCRRWSLVRGRNLRKGRGDLALRLAGR
jgi:hypothetical protein